MSQLVTLNIRGMTCASCVARLEKSLSKVAGVDAASVNLATEKAQIRVNQEPQLITDLLIAAVEKTGFEASVFSRAQASPAPTNIIDLHGKGPVILAIALSLPLIAPMLLVPFGVHWMLPAWAQFLLATPVQFILGSRFYVAGFKALRMGSGNMDLLVALGTTAAYGLSIYTWYLSDWGRAYEPHELYFESSAVVISLVMLGKWLEARAKKETTTAITALQSLWPDQAKLLRQHDLNQLDYEHLPIAQILPGDWVLVLPGERMPVDGVVIEGLSEIDESMLTGESKLLEKEKGSTVIGGSLNGSGRLIIQATGIGETSVLAKMISLVENAQAEKAPIQRLVDQVSTWFVPTVVVIAAINYLVHALILNDSQNALLYSVAILVIACPCALGLATPVAIMAGTGVAAKLGILIKDAEALELAHRINFVAFDKTGTLTLGKPSVKNFTNFSASDDQQIHALALGLQMGSEHPLAKAMIQFGGQHQVNAESYSTVLANIGKGIEGQCLSGSYQGKKIAFVSFHAIKEGTSDQIQQAASKELNFGHSVSCLVDVTDSSNHQILAVYSFGDELKPNVSEAIERLKSMKIKTIMISGDNQLVANLLAQKIGIDEVYAEVLPAQKAAIIQSLKDINGRSYVAMIGDGVNDAPALAVADVGIAVSTGTDIAMHAASITLMRGDPALVPDAIEISIKTWKKIKQNLFWAFVYNLIGIPLAALGYLTPMIAGAAMAASSVSVVGNALLLRKWSRPKS
jgi:Cu+-exporting ATPase